ncbi:MAG: porin family protein [Vicinamibacterales bacterium]
MGHARTGVVCAAVWAMGLAAATPAAAQAVVAGVKGGVVAGRLATGDSGAFDTTARAGATAGVFLGTTLGRLGRFQVEALFAERRFRSSGLPVEIAVRSRGLEVPLLVQLVAPAGRRVRPLVFAGPQLSLISSVRQTASGQSIDLSDRVVDLDVAATFGAGLEVAAGRGALVVDGRAVIGLRQLHAAAPPTYRSRAFALLLGYRF